jgi:hypothetical protein
MAKLAMIPLAENTIHSQHQDSSHSTVQKRIEQQQVKD